MFEAIKAIALAVVILVIVREVIAFMVFGIDDKLSGIDTRDPEGGTFGKSLNWHKRTVVNTTINTSKKDPSTASGYAETSRVIRKAKGK